VLPWLLATSSWADAPPASAKDKEIAYKAIQYQRLLKGYAYIHWKQGDAPIPLLAGQIHQESRWNPNARSKFACGLSQFTPETAEWISATYKVDVGPGTCTDPAWSLRAHAAYMRYLQTRQSLQGATSCDTWRFALWGYNGGPGWVTRDKALTAKLGGNPSVASVVAGVNAGRAEGFFKENRGYDRAILGRWQHLYLTWGGPVTCGGIVL
jgi:soluble lytic murein transglycosylase-like protein